MRANHAYRRALPGALACLLAVLAAPLLSVGVAGEPASLEGSKPATTSGQAKGSFRPRISPLPPEPDADPTLGRMSIDKQFEGDLEGFGKGQMLTGMTAVKGSAGYVAIERITGTLAGRTGSFTLQHSGVMNKGVPSLSITVIPDSGTNGLTGIAGAMSIDINPNGDHFYTFEYTLPTAD